MDVVRSIARGDRIEKIVISEAWGLGGRSCAMGPHERPIGWEEEEVHI